MSRSNRNFKRKKEQTANPKNKVREGVCAPSGAGSVPFAKAALVLDELLTGSLRRFGPLEKSSRKC